MHHFPSPSGSPERASRLAIHALVLAVAAIVAFSFQGTRGLWEPDEGFYVSTATAMYETGDLLVPRLHHLPFLDKPPLTYWGIVAGMKTLGRSEWGARAFHAVCLLATVALVMLLGGRLWGHREGVLAGIVYATMAGTVGAANVVTPDTPLTVCAAAAFYCFVRSVQAAPRRAWAWKLALCAAFGVGFLAKGPAMLILSLPMFTWLLVRRRVLSYFITPWAILGFALFVLIGLTWYVVVARLIPEAAAYFWDNQVAGRLATEGYDRNPEWWKGPAIYLPALGVGALPWSAVTVLFAWRLRRAGGVWRRLVASDSALLVALWVTMPLLVLMAAASKLPLYVLPLFPALALGMARTWTLDRDDARATGERAHQGTLPWRALPLRRWHVAAVATWALILIGAKATLAYRVNTGKDARHLWAAIQPHLPAAPYELCLVDDRLNGLDFYTPAMIENVTVSDDPYPFFAMPEPLEEELAEMRRSRLQGVFLVRRSRRVEEVRSALLREGVPFREVPLPDKRHLIVCDPVGPDLDQRVAFVALGDVGERTAGLHAITNALARLDGENSFEDGVLLLGDNTYENPTRAHLGGSLARTFERPWGPLLGRGIPFFAVLGNHDYDVAGMVRHQTEYAPFGMGGERYYTRRFGEGAVEVFFLDSNTLRSEPAQREWLRGALEASTARWKVIAMHHPLRTTARRPPLNAAIRGELEELFQRAGVSIVIAGHEHVYERLEPVGGVHHFTVGGTAKLRTGDLQPRAAGRAAGTDTTQAFLHLSFSGDTAVFTAYDTTNAVLDEGTIRLPARKQRP